MAIRTSAAGRLSVQGLPLECVERGQRRPILWLHGEEGLDAAGPFLDRLGAQGRVLP